jgi:hypothetical protein
MLHIKVTDKLLEASESPCQPSCASLIRRDLHELAG